MLKNNHLCIWYTFLVPFLPNRFSKGSVSKQKMSKSEVINSFLEGHCTLIRGLFQAKTLYSLRHVFKIVLQFTNSLQYLLRNLRTRYREGRFIKLNVCNGNPTGNCHPFFFWHDKNFCIFFWSHTLCRDPNELPFKLPKQIGDIAFTSDESLLLFLL